MKKLMTGVAAIALITTSCAKNEVANTNSNPNAVGFELSTGKTRATTTDLSGLKADANGFGVYAENGASKTMFIDNKNFAFANGKWGWKTQDIMWPTTDTDYPIDFYAYYPTSLQLGGFYNTWEQVAIEPSDGTLIIRTPNTTAEQEDILFAAHKDVIARPASGNVSLNFKHILSKVDFKVVTGATVTAEVQSITVKYVANAGFFDFRNVEWTPQQKVSRSYYSMYDYMKAPVVAGNIFANQTTAKAVTPANGSMMLMPQELTTLAWDKTAASLADSRAHNRTHIEVVYRLYDTATGKDIVGFSDATKHPDYPTLGKGEKQLFVKVGYSLPTVWEMGKAYTYTIYLGTPDGSGGNLTDDKFIDEKGGNTDLPVIIDGEKKDKPDPIFNDKPIGFIVSVDNWDDRPGIDVK